MTTAQVDWRGFDPAEPKLAEMQAAAQRFADEIASGMPPRWLTFTGKPGIGKTHLARCLSRWFDSRGCYHMVGGCRVARSQGFAKWRTLSTDLRNGDWRLVDDLCERYFLVLDDIGADFQGGTGAVQAALDRLIDERIGKWTVLTTNLPHAEVATTLGTRVASRMIRDGNVIIDAPTVRDWNLKSRAA